MKGKKGRCLKWPMIRESRVGPDFAQNQFGRIAAIDQCLKGEMSLVGPRAHEPEEVSQYTLEQRKLLTIRPE